MSENNRMTNVPEFLGDLDAGVFMNKISAALNNVALGTDMNGGTGEVHLVFKFVQIDDGRLEVQHKLKMITPTKRGKKSEEDTTKTPMWVGKGGKMTLLPEDQGQLFGIDGSVDGKLKTVK
ncbi:Prophage protein [Morganella morganii]|uniref:hypothetical protein n=1 Tax=Morganella morganii TaxID=582 RepID=UPI003B270136